MDYVKLSSILLMVLLSLITNISQVTCISFQIMNKSRDFIDKSDLENRPHVYEAYFPDDQNLEQQEQLFNSRPIVPHFWRNLHNSRIIQSYFTTGNSYRLPHLSLLPKTSDNHFGKGNQQSIESQVGYYKQELDDASNGLANTIERTPEKLINHQATMSKLHNRSDLIAKTYVDSHKFSGPQNNQRAYYKMMPKVLNSRFNTHDQSIESALTAENIYQPRSQVIYYKFHSPFKSLTRIDKWNTSKQVYNKNFVDSDNAILNRYQHRRVKSDQPNKIRHHHGEWRRPFF